MAVTTRRTGRKQALIIAACAALSAGSLWASDAHWIDSAGGIWTDASKWSNTDVPDAAAENAILDAAGTYAVTSYFPLSIGDLTIQTATAELKLQMSGSGAYAFNSISNSGTITLDAPAPLSP